jgi:hypothetical protein
MGLWGLVKRLFGFKKREPASPFYGVPFTIVHGSQESSYPSRAFWLKRRKEFEDELEWAREKRSRYGG